MGKLCCPECKGHDLLIQIKLVFAFDGENVGEMRCDGPDENIEPDNYVECQTCQWTGTYDDLVEPSGPPSLWDNDLIQFARLLDEITGVLDDEEVRTRLMRDLMHTMDLSLEELDSLFARAERVWERAKRDRSGT